jgi:hypothetical protein
MIFFLMRLSDWFSGEAEVEHGLEEFSDALMAEAKIIAESDVGWVVGFFMIDKCCASVRAIQQGEFFLFQQSMSLADYVISFSVPWGAYPHLSIPCDPGACCLI